MYLQNFINSTGSAFSTADLMPRDLVHTTVHNMNFCVAKLDVTQIVGSFTSGLFVREVHKVSLFSKTTKLHTM